METKKIFIPFYLEYVGTYSLKKSLGGFEGLVFRKVDGIYVFVYNVGESRTIHCREIGDNVLFGDDMWLRKSKRYELVQKIGGTIMSGDFSELEFRFFDGSLSGSSKHVLKSYSKDQYLLAILNCLDMNFSSEDMISDEVNSLWDRVRKVDEVRFRDLYKNIVGVISDIGLSRSDTMLEEQGRYLSEKIYNHFKNYKMKEKIDLNKIEGIRDVEDGIDFVKLPSKSRFYGLDFDLIGLKENGDGEYTLINRGVSKDVLNTRRYCVMSYVEKEECVPLLIDQDTNVTSVLIQWRNGENLKDVHYRSGDGDLDIKNEHRCIIEAIISSGLDKEEEKEKGDNSETEEERRNREFTDDLVKISELIGKKIDGDYRKYITSKDSSLILYYLKTIIDHLKSLEPKD